MLKNEYTTWYHTPVVGVYDNPPDFSVPAVPSVLFAKLNALALNQQDVNYLYNGGYGCQLA